MSPRILVILGTRPEAIKQAPVIAALKRDAGFEPMVLASGQHRELVDPILRDFGITPDYPLDLMRPGQTLAEFGARLLTALPPLLRSARPHLALVQGDTATALFAAQTCFCERVPVAHVEAGLRTGNLESPFPEEAFRTMLARIAQLHFAPTEASKDNLLAEGIPAERVHVTGNSVIDALRVETEKQTTDPAVRAAVDAVLDPEFGAGWRRTPYVLITGHRRENFGQGFARICEAILELASRYPDHRFIYPVHLNPNVKKVVHKELGGAANIALLPPMAYRPFVGLLAHCRLVLTDSGGIQEEAPSLGKPVIVMRDTTERPEGVAAGTVRLAGTDTPTIVAETHRLLADPAEYARMSRLTNPYGDGKTAARILRILKRTNLAALRNP